MGVRNLADARQRIRALLLASALALGASLHCHKAECAAYDPGCHPEAFLAYRYPVARFVYIAGPSAITAFRVNLSDGVLTSVGSPTAVASGPLAVIADPSGQALYVARYAADVIDTYRIDGQSGALQLQGSLSTLGGSADLAVHPQGRFLYAVSNEVGSVGVSSFAIDPFSAALSAVTTFGTVGWSDPNRIAVSSDGRFLNIGDDGSNSIHSMRVDPTTGIPADNGTVVFSSDGELVYHPALPVLYYSNTSQALAGVIDGVTGAASQLGGVLPAGVGTTGIAIDPRGRFAYFASDTGTSLFQYPIAAGGALSANGAAPSVAGAARLAIDRNALFVLMSNSTTGTATSYRIDQNSGVLQQSGQLSAGAGANSIAIAYF